jgi:hypothetical protein
MHISGMAVRADGLLRTPVFIVICLGLAQLIETVSDDAVVDELSLLFHHPTEPSRKVWHQG